MNKGMVLVGVVLLALFGIGIVYLVTAQQSGAELDYYLVKETTEAAITDSIDYSFYADHGQIRMDKEKFMESFVRRFADSAASNRKYKIDVYDINETPPKVSVKVSSTIAGLNNQTGNVDITTNVDMLLESDYYIDPTTTNKNWKTMTNRPYYTTKSNN
ncbi:MAG: hypothetical protein J6B89_00050 [Bacilli bacterium]|nr:hypothetical protein [Bacilli bacterium]